MTERTTGRACASFGRPRRSGGGWPGLALSTCLVAAWPALAQPVQSHGRDVPLQAALARLVPGEVRVALDDPALADRPISWSPGPDWRVVLRTALERQGLRLEGAGSEFAIREIPRPPPRAPARRTEAQAERLPSREPPRPSQTEAGLWRARAGQTLEQVLGEWAARAGWTLVFNTAIVHDLQAPFEARGEFVDAASQLIKAIEARPAPRGVFYLGNRVLVVTTSLEEAR